MRSRPLPRTTRVWTRDSASLDHRPRRISVGEITTEQKEDITEHFKVSTMTFSFCYFSKLKWIYVAQEYNQLSMVKEGHISLVQKMAFNLHSGLNPSRLLTIEVIMSKTKHRFHPMSSHQKYQYQTQEWFMIYSDTEKWFEKRVSQDPLWGFWILDEILRGI